MIRGTLYRRMPWSIPLLISALLVIGLLFVRSASYRPATGSVTADPYKQAIWITLGAALFVACLLVKTQRFADWIGWLYGAGLLAIMACYLFPAVKGAQRWIALDGLAKIQPSEFMKVILALALARFLTHRPDLHRVRPVAGALLMAAVPTVLVFRQPDLGTATLFIPMVMVMLWVAGARTRLLGGLIVLGVLAAVGFYFSPLIKPHQKARIDAFVNPSPASEQREGYQLAESKIAIGSGGLSGKGLGEGSQNFMGQVPFDNSDFIFAVIGEEWGFVGAVGTLGLLLALIVRALGVAAASRDPFGRLVVVGLMTPIAMQTVVNSAMTVGLVPITGMTLPLISYGGSSMIATLAALGIVCNIAVHRPIVLATESYPVHLPPTDSP